VLLGVASVLKLNTFRNEALAAFLTATANNVATGFGGHTGAETELGFAGALGWLISAFAHGENLCVRSIGNRLSSGAGAGLYGRRTGCQSTSKEKFLRIENFTDFVAERALPCG
jgi:hypothetical protein